MDLRDLRFRVGLSWIEEIAGLEWDYLLLEVVQLVEHEGQHGSHYSGEELSNLHLLLV